MTKCLIYDSDKIWNVDERKYDIKDSKIRAKSFNEKMQCCFNDLDNCSRCGFNEEEYMRRKEMINNDQLKPNVFGLLRLKIRK